MGQQLIIKNMVCPRCKEAVSRVFRELGLSVNEMGLGNVTIEEELNAGQKEQLKTRLAELGFELLDDKRRRLINKIKSVIIDEIYYQKERSALNFSNLLSEKLHYDYSYLSRLFSLVEGRTIERFIQTQKIERAKELMVYDELSLSEIAFQMNYSSSAHLSAQFKKITGMTPTAFRKLRDQERTSLDRL